MCGIVGTLRFGDIDDAGNEQHKWMRRASLLITSGILEKTEKRGKDATGVSALFEDGRFILQKMGIDAKAFMSRFGGKKEDFQGFMKILREYEPSLRIVTGHCRKKSVGGAFDNVNNHPIKASKIVGLHNGTLKNHEIIFDKLKGKRDGDVDSEAIFRLLGHYTKNGKEPFTMEMVEETLKRLEGSFSVIAYNIDNPNQVVVGRDARPAEFCLVKPLKTVFVASEKCFIEHALWHYNQLAGLFHDGELPRIKAADAEFQTLVDDTAGIFDLTKEIDDTTTVMDLLDTKKLPLAGQRLWKVPTKSTTTTTNYGNANGGYQGRRAVNHTVNQNSMNKKKVTTDGQAESTGVTTESQDVTAATSKNEAAPEARVWNPAMGKYLPKSEVSVMEESKIIDLEKKSINTLTQSFSAAELESADPYTKKDANTTDLGTEEEGTSEPIKLFQEKAISLVEKYTKKEPVKINSVKPIEAKKIDTLKAIKTKAENAKINSRDKLDGQKAAIIAAKNLQRLDSVEEVIELLEIEVENLDKLSIPALTNRLLKTQFSDQFVKGWMAKCENTKDSSIKTESSEIETRPRKHIRVLKHVVEALGNYDGIEPIDAWAKKWAEKYSGGTSEITAETLLAVFNDGDLRVNDKVTAMVRHVNA